MLCPERILQVFCANPAQSAATALRPIDAPVLQVRQGDRELVPECVHAQRRRPLGVFIGTMLPLPSSSLRAYLDGQFQKELLSSRVPVCIAEKHADAGPYDGFINYHEGSPCVTPKPCVGMACAWRSMSVASKDRNGSLGPTLCRSSCSKRGCPTSSTRPEKTERRARLRSSAALLP